MVTSVSERLEAKVGLLLPSMLTQAERIWSSEHVTRLYPEYLMTMHTIVRSAVPLMERAIARAKELADQDPVARGLISYLEHHVDEERGHDQWLLEDLAVTGVDPQEALTRIPSVRAAELVGAQYYWIQHHHPVALLGHMAAIEGHPPPIGFAARLERLTGYPAQAFRAIAIHERLDIRHGRELFAAIDALPLSRSHEAMVGVSALHTLKAAGDVLEEVHERGMSRVRESAVAARA